MEGHMKKKNPFGKSINIQDFIAGKKQPYAVFKGTFEGWGDVTIAVLKTYKLPKNEAGDRYARWFTAAKSDMTMGRWEFGDQYALEVIHNHKLVEAYPTRACRFSRCIPNA
jgi:hypothetical protein